MAVAICRTTIPRSEQTFFWVGGLQTPFVGGAGSFCLFDVFFVALICMREAWEGLFPFCFELESRGAKDMLKASRLVCWFSSFQFVVMDISQGSLFVLIFAESKYASPPRPSV